MNLVLLKLRPMVFVPPHGHRGDGRIWMRLGPEVVCVLGNLRPPLPLRQEKELRSQARLKLGRGSWLRSRDL